MGLRNWCLVLEYDGGRYCGWQVQPNAPSIQGEVEGVLSTILRETVSLAVAGRTDTGVHALGQVANFKTGAKFVPARLGWQVNALLPNDIVIREIKSVDDDFDARRSARHRTYSYQILNRAFGSAFWRQHSWFVSKPLNISVAAEAARHLVGSHDFSAFTVAKEGPMIRRVTELKIARGSGSELVFSDETQTEGLISIRVTANAFLHHMVRLIVGTLVDVATGKLTPEQVRQILESKDVCQAGPRAPARGLRLEKVDYSISTSDDASKVEDIGSGVTAEL